jgi:molybdopterin-biosynthesis enzyme MoeA-like protein
MPRRANGRPSTGQKAPLFMLGLTMALLAHIPFVGLLVPALAALSFVHYGLEALRRSRWGHCHHRGDGYESHFGAIIIGDEILSGKRQDKHFAKIAELLGARGLRLSWVEYLGDDRERLAATFKRTMAAGDVVFSCGGIGNTPDDHTRQAVAAALGVDLALHPAGFEELKVRFAGEEITDKRKLLVTFPAGVKIIPNPFNRIPGFMANDHYFVPGFPQMAHPMIEWALDTFIAISSRRLVEVLKRLSC